MHKSNVRAPFLSRSDLMKSRFWLPILLTGCLLSAAVPVARSQSIMDRIKAKAKAKVEQKEDNAASSAVNAADPTANAGGSPASNSSSPNHSSSTNNAASGNSSNTAGNAGEA